VVAVIVLTIALASRRGIALGLALTFGAYGVLKRDLIWARWCRSRQEVACWPRWRWLGDL